MLESSVTGTGQTVLPEEVRAALAVQSGDKVRYIIEGEEVRIAKARPVSRLYGILYQDGADVSLQDMERAIAEGATGK